MCSGTHADPRYSKIVLHYSVPKIIPFLFSTFASFLEGVSGTDDQVLDASMKCFDQLWSAHLRQLKIHSIPTHAEHLALVRAVRGSAPIACCVAM